MIERDGHRPGALAGVVGPPARCQAAHRGFVLTGESATNRWQAGVREQRFRRPAGGAA